MSEKKLNREGALHYAKLAGLDLPDDMKDKALVRAIEDHIGDQEDACEICEHMIRDDDVYCWYCGADVSPTGDGGWDKVKPGAKPKAPSKAQLEEKPTENITESYPEPQEAPQEVPEPAPATQDAPRKRGRPRKAATASEGIPEAEPVSVPAAVPTEGEQLTLTQCTDAIRSLDRTTGSSAWRIGKHIVAIIEGLYEEKYKTFDDYCLKELGWTSATAYGYKKIAEKFTEEEASQLGVFKLLALAGAPEDARPKLFKAALPKTDGGKGLDRKDLRKAIKDEWEKERGEPKPREKVPGSGRKRTESPFKPFVGTKVKGEYDDESKTYLLDLGDGIGVEVKLSGKKSQIISMEFVEFVEEEVEAEA